MNALHPHPNVRAERHPRPGIVTALAVAIATAAWSTGARADRVAGMGASSAQATQALQGRTLQKLEGGSLSFATLRGQVVVINFWASWCSPCRRELPRLQVLDAEIAKQGGRVIAVSIDEDRRNVELFVQRNGLKLPVALDGPDGLARLLDLRAVPLTVVLDRSGQIAYSTTRSDDAGLSQLASAVRQLLADRPVASVPEGGSR